MHVQCVLEANTGIIALVGFSERYEEGHEIEYNVANYGIRIFTGQLDIPLPARIAQYMIDNGQDIFMYSYAEDDLISEHIGTTTLDRDKLLKSLGEWEARAIEKPLTANLHGES